MVIFIGALVRRRDGDTSVVMIVDIDFCNRNNKNNKVTNDKSECKQYYNGRKQGLRFILSLVQVLSTIKYIIGSYNYPSTCNKESLQSH